ncbi:hypothetical protein KIW84_073142 [Lathyrus oleraceus]|uniref:Uncharacterized protein n=1 Tax=Pisum sativum TaxID=3888 RepID=A0A9D4VP86_PEA|nr:hypothetical protein KIW84_073142 [Pisum sativum]
MKNSRSQKERNEGVKYYVRPAKTNKIRLRIHHRRKLVETPVNCFYRGLRPLNNDRDVLKFSKYVVGYDVIDVYVEHTVVTPEIIDDNEVDAEDDVQCTEFKSADVTEEDGELDANIEVGGKETPNGVAEEVTTEPNVVAEEVATDVNSHYAKNDF